jgi:hypothetical protein
MTTVAAGVKPGGRELLCSATSDSLASIARLGETVGVPRDAVRAEQAVTRVRRGFAGSDPAGKVESVCANLTQRALAALAG